MYSFIGLRKMYDHIRWFWFEGQKFYPLFYLMFPHIPLKTPSTYVIYKTKIASSYFKPIGIIGFIIVLSNKTNKTTKCQCVCKILRSLISCG